VRASQFIAIVVVILMASASAARAQGACRGVDEKLTSGSKQEYAALIAQDLRGKVKPSQVEELAFMKEGAWSVAYVSTPVSDNGYFFSAEERGTKRAKDVWGGMAEPSERTQIAGWAKKLGAPDRLARCFALHATGE
jgi:hypothetical protein